MIHSNLVWFLWWLRHGAIGPIEATLFRVNVDWPDFRINTFELVIRLSKVQLALPLCTFFHDVLLLRWSHSNLCELHSPQSEADPNHQKLLFCCSFCHDSGITTCTRNQAGTRLSGVVFFFWWLSGEVNHIVHLIRWNLKAVYANWGKTWPRSRQGNNARLLGI